MTRTGLSPVIYIEKRSDRYSLFSSTVRGSSSLQNTPTLPYELQLQLPPPLVRTDRELPPPSFSPLPLPSSRLQPLPHDRRGAQQLHPRLSGHPAGLLVLPALPAAVARRHRHPPHFGRSAQHQHHQPHQQTGQIRLGGSHQGLWTGLHWARCGSRLTDVRMCRGKAAVCNTSLLFWLNQLMSHSHSESVSNGLPLPPVSAVIKYTSYCMTLTVTPPPVVH